MAATYRDRQDSKIYGPRLIIFRRKGSPTDGSFSFRAKIDGHKGCIRRTLKETNPDRAMILAEQEYENLRVRDRGGFSLNSKPAILFPVIPKTATLREFRCEDAIVETVGDTTVIALHSSTRRYIEPEISFS